MGRPSVEARLDAGLVLCPRTEGKSWREIAEAHPLVRLLGGKVKPSAGSIRRVDSTEFLSSEVAMSKGVTHEACDANASPSGHEASEVASSSVSMFSSAAHSS